MNFIIRWLVTAVAVGVAVWLVPGMELLGGTDAWVGIAIFGLILSLVNISIKPIMQVLSLPISVITLGIFYLVVNTLMLYIAAWLANEILRGFWALAAHIFLCSRTIGAEKTGGACGTKHCISPAYR